MKIQHKGWGGKKYEGIPAANVLGVALSESSNMRNPIDKECNYDPKKRILSLGIYPIL